jgi:hypothetical protein
MFLGDTELGQVQIDDWAEEAEEEEAAIEEEELARVQQEIENAIHLGCEEQESILRRHAAIQHAKARR